MLQFAYTLAWWDLAEAKCVTGPSYTKPYSPRNQEPQKPLSPNKTISKMNITPEILTVNLKTRLPQEVCVFSTEDIQG